MLTHTLLLLYECNQLLQDLVQNPVEGNKERREREVTSCCQQTLWGGAGERLQSLAHLHAPAVTHTHTDTHTDTHTAVKCAPVLDVEVLAQVEVLEGRMSGESRQDREQVGIESCPHTDTHAYFYMH